MAVIMDKQLLAKRRLKNQIGRIVMLIATAVTIAVLVILLARIVIQGSTFLSFEFIQQFASRIPDQAGVKAALVGTLWLLSVVAPTAMIVGVGSAIYLEEYAKRNRFTKFIQMNIANLASVPSVVFGLLGLTIFVRMLALGQSILAAGFTLCLLILPVIIVAAQEAIRAVPSELKDASLAMGATKWQTTVLVILPNALPGIATGSILALSRAIGETAPLVVLGIPVILQFLPSGYLDTFTALPMQIYDWAKRPNEAFQQVAAAGIIVLLVILISMNALAVWIRHTFNDRRN